MAPRGTVLAARRAKRDGQPGWYVVGPLSKLPIAGPYKREQDANEDLERRNNNPFGYEFTVAEVTRGSSETAS